MKSKFFKILSVVLSSFLMFGCKIQDYACQDTNIHKIEIIEPESFEGVIEIGKFNEAGLELQITYDNNSVSSIDLTDKFIPSNYKKLLEEPGIHTIDILFRGELVSYTVEMAHFHDVTFVNNGKELYIDHVANGRTAVYLGDTPTKERGVQYSYVFLGWDKELENVKESFSTNAVFDSLINSYNIYWKNYDGSLLDVEAYNYGDLPSYKGDMPSKNADAQYSYSFTGWSPSIHTVNGEETYIANYSETRNEYTVTWVNYDDTILNEEIYQYGEMPTYKGEVPTRPSEPNVNFYFSGWTPSLEAVTSNTIYKAVYRQEKTHCIVTFVVDGVNYHEETVAFNSIIPTPKSPVKDGFVFVDWYYEPAFENEFDFSLPIQDDVSIYAKFLPLNEYNPLFEININGNECIITSFLDDTETLSIPKYINGYVVTSIGESAFENCISLTSIEIPNSITSVADNAFSKCTLLKDVYYKGTIENWCNITFSDCDSNPMYYASHFYMFDKNTKYEEVTKIVISNTITTIGSSQFYGFKNVTSIEIPNNVTSIGNCAFYGCSSLITIEIPNSVINIGVGAFLECGSLQYNDYGSCLYLGNKGNSFLVLVSAKDIFIKEATIQISTKFIIESAFKDCSYLGTIKIPNSVISIGIGAFSGCCSLTSIDISNSVKSIGINAFSNCSSLTKIEIPNSVTCIGIDAFSNCNSLTSITIPNSVISIGNGAFSGCCSLMSLVIPNSVLSIGMRAFSNCNSLTIYCEAWFEPLDWANVCGNGMNLSWNCDQRPVYWADEWSYVNGIPTPNK